VRRLLPAALAALALLAGCDLGDDSGLVFEDPKGTIEVEEGMTFSLEFSVNAGVGFDWMPVASATEGPVAYEGSEVEYPSGNRAGDSGRKRFTYEARSSGTRRLAFRHLFRGDVKETRTVTVEVRG
jgi:predicted secreted protein